VVYGASGLSKLVDRDWFGGTVTWHRMVQVRDQLERRPCPDGRSPARRPVLPHRAAKVIVLTELFIALGLWWRATRYAAVWVAVVFHVAIQLSAVGPGVLLPGHRRPGHLGGAVDPRPGRPLSTRRRPPPPLAEAVEALDWLARFRWKRAAAARRSPHRSRRQRRRPARARGRRVLSRLPLTAWFALPLLLVPAPRPVPPRAG
jgi:hypothetical protein